METLEDKAEALIEPLAAFATRSELVSTEIQSFTRILESHMAKRLLILGGVLVVGLIGVAGFYMYLDSQVPKGDPQFEKEPAAEAAPIEGGAPMAPPA